MALIMTEWCHRCYRYVEREPQTKKHKCHFRCMNIPFFGEMVSKYSVKTSPNKPYALNEISPEDNGRPTVLLFMCFSLKFIK